VPNVWTKLKSLLAADESATSALGWSCNFAIFRIPFLTAAVLPWAIHILSWTDRIFAGLPRELWAPVWFYGFPLEVLANVTFGRTLAIVNVLLIVVGIIGLPRVPAPIPIGLEPSPRPCYFSISSPGVAELADAADSKSAGTMSRVGSTPSSGTIFSAMFMRLFEGRDGYCP
jgi:hypothetical protein